MIKLIIFDLDDTLYPDKVKSINKVKSLELVKRLSKKYDLVVLSNGKRKKILARIQDLGIKPFLKNIYLRTYFVHRKPFPTKVFKILNDFGLNKKEVILVGDKQYTDILVAKLSGIKSVLVTNSKKKTLFIEPSYKINSILDLERLLEKIF